MKRTMIAAFVAAALSGAATTETFAQGVERSEAIASSDVLSQISVYSYRDGPKSELSLRGTPPAAAAGGKVEVEYQNANARISAEVKNLPKPASLGPYTTYVLWAVSPDGRATSQGVIGGPEGGKGKLETRYGASQFALIVTAEPHFAVTIPSTMVVLYNVGDNVKGVESKVTTLTERVDYTSLAGARLSRMAVDEANPLEVVQARYAIAIARAAGADRFSSTAFVTANQKLAAAETALVARKSYERKLAPGFAREAVIAGEDARRSALLAATESATADEKRSAEVAATNTANDAAAVAATTAAAAAAVSSQAASNAATNAANDTARVAAGVAATEAAASSQAASTAATNAANDTARVAAGVAATEAAASSQAASQAATAVEHDRAAVAARVDLRNRLNEALPTHDSNRGLVAEIGGVQFATGTADINNGARESLSKFSGIVASYPGLRFKVEGHTDNTGSAAMNTKLSLKRAMTVRDYLIGQGVPASSIDVAGLGMSMPIGDNSTTAGRERNRRVEIVVSGGPLIAAN
jgi:outer membrane protein OmpA-like peptidoglycan-associated protein